MLRGASASVKNRMATPVEQASDRLRDALARIVALPQEAVIKAALACGDLRDFLRRLAA